MLLSNPTVAGKRRASESEKNPGPQKSARSHCHPTTAIPSGPNPAPVEEDNPQNSPVLFQDIQQISSSVNQVTLFNSATTIPPCSSSSSSRSSSVIPTRLSLGVPPHSNRGLVDHTRLLQLAKGLEPLLHLRSEEMYFTYPKAVLQDPTFKNAFNPETFRHLVRDIRVLSEFMNEHFIIRERDDDLVVNTLSPWQPAPGYVKRSYDWKISADGKEAGTITVDEHWQPGGSEVEIRWVFVQPDFRQKGLATSSLRALTQFYDQPELNMKEMTLTVGSNTPITGLIYARLGFEMDQKALNTVSSAIGIPVDRLRAKFLKDSTPPWCVEDNEGEYVTKWGEKFDPDLQDDLEDLSDMHRPRGAKGFSVSTNATEEEIMKAYREAHQPEATSASSSSSSIANH